jgi:hypothetical protein
MMGELGIAMYWQAEGQAWGRLKIESEDMDGWADPLETEVCEIALDALYEQRFWERQR